MSTATERLARYVEAEKKILEGQSVRMSDRMLTRADLSEVRAEIKDLQSQAAAESRTAAGNYGPRALLADLR